MPCSSGPSACPARDRNTVPFSRGQAPARAGPDRQSESSTARARHRDMITSTLTLVKKGKARVKGRGEFTVSRLRARLRSKEVRHAAYHIPDQPSDRADDF